VIGKHQIRSILGIDFLLIRLENSKRMIIVQTIVNKKKVVLSMMKMILFISKMNKKEVIIKVNQEENVITGEADDIN
jgi:hypothetical protein